jgi:tryptophan-rich sensory protein
MKLIICIAIPLIIGGISGFFTTEAIPTWYAGLQKPSFNPPNWIFGPVWTALYVIMGISLYMIVNLPQSAQRTQATWIFAGQMLLNFGWSFIFFKWQKPSWAFAEIILLWIFILWMIVSFYKLKPVAGLLQLPYIAWVSFASVLNYAIWQLNK